MQIDNPRENIEDKEKAMENKKEESAYPNPSECDDLKIDLESALKGDFEFKGNYAFTTPLPQAPNPGLHIAGLGLIGLPLSERDARLVIGSAEQAPFGHGERTVIDTAVRDTYEVQAGKVSFRNPAWEGFMKQLISGSVWPELGVGTYKTDPKCELYKLLLYKTGSHFLPHQDTEKERGMFATVIIVLPSFYSGGEVCVSHGSTSKIFDLASSSAFTTSLLAWYTDVMHEVKPITSGYRLALSYNLIHTSPGIPRPTLPNMHSAVTRLRDVFEKWYAGAYKNDVDEWEADIVAYILQHKYNQVNLKMGALKGEDRHLMAHLRGVAEEKGFMVCLANLEFVESGYAEDCGGYYKRSRYDCYGSDEDEDDAEDTPGMAEVEEKTLTVSNLVDLDGVDILGGQKLPLREQNLIPENAFEDASPDDTEYEGYQGNAAGTLEYFYRRTVLVLFAKEREVEILLSSGGVPYALKKVTKADPSALTEEDRRTAQYIIRCLSSEDQVTKTAMANIALEWEDLEMWKHVVKASGAEQNIDVLGNAKYVEAWKKFSFNAVQPIFQTSITHCTSLKKRLDFINNLLPHAPEEERGEVAAWCKEQTSQAFVTLKPPSKDDALTFILIMRSEGLSFFSDIILPQLANFKSVYDFWVEFIPSLYNQKQDLINHLASGTDSKAAETAFDAILDQSLDSALSQWEPAVSEQKPASNLHSAYLQAIPSPLHAKRICRLVHTCISIGHAKSCEGLLDLVMKSPGDLSDKFRTIYVPLIPELRRTLATHSVDFVAQPFKEFFYLIIGTYMQHILGCKPSRHAELPKVRKIGCGCNDCKALDSFMASARITETFRYAQHRRYHLQHRLSPDLVTYTTNRTGSPHGLVITKKPELIPAEHWKVRLREAKTFLASIGDNVVIAKIMGDRYVDVMNALAGKQQFILTPTDVAYRPTTSVASAALTAVSGSVPASALAPSALPPPTFMPQNLSRNTGQKRKKTPLVDGDVVDLTGDSP